jgi:hypothetical protein
MTYYNDTEPTVTVTVDPSYRDGDLYEMVVGGVIFGDGIDPARYPIEGIDLHDTDGVLEATVRPCSWTASRNAGGVAATPRDYHRPWHEKTAVR